MNFLTRFSLKNATAVLLLVVLITGAGIYSAQTMKQETMPDITIPYIAIATAYPGASPDDVLENVTKPIERALSGTSGLKNLTSTSAENVSLVVLEFDFDTDMDKTKTKVEEALKKIQFPDGVLTPNVTRISFGSFPVLKIAVTNPSVSPLELEEKVKDVVLPSISGVEGVGQAQLETATTRAYYVKLDAAKLRDRNLTYQDVKNQILGNNLSFPTGELTEKGLVKPVRVTGKIENLDQLKNLSIVIYPNQAETMSTAFAQIGKGIGTIGSAVGQLGGAVGQLGQGLSTVSTAFGTQIGLLTAITDLQNNLFNAKMALMSAQATLRDPTASDADKAAATALVSQLTPQVSMMESALSSLRAQLTSLQDQMKQQASTQKLPTSLKPTARKTGSSISVPEPTLEQVTLKELGSVYEGTGKTDAISRMNGSPSVVIDVLKTQEGNTVDVADNVRAKMDEIKDRLPAGTEFTYFLDQSKSVKASIKGMLNEGLLGALFAFVVILLFLGNIRSTIIAAVSIPLSVLIALTFLKQFGVTLNIMTLGGLTVAIGRVVDDSIVVIENIYRHLQMNEKRTENLVLVGAREVTSAITSSTITTVGVFVPLAMVSGIVGKFFVPFATAVSLAMASSLLVAVTVVPLLAKLLMLNGRVRPHAEGGGALVRAYRRTLQVALNHKIVTVVIALGLFGLSLTLLGKVGTSFIPESKEKIVAVDITMKPGTEIAKTDEVAKKIEAIFEKDPDVEQYQTSVGSPKGSLTISGGVEGSNAGHVYAKLKPGVDAQKKIRELRSRVATIDSSAKTSVYLASTIGMGNTSKLQLFVYGDRIEDIQKAAELITAKLSTMEGLENVTNNLSQSKPEIDVNVDQKKASTYGLNTAIVLGTVRQVLGEETVGTVSQKGKVIDIKMGLASSGVDTVSDLKNLEITTPLGKKIKLSQVATVEERPGPVSVFRRNSSEYAEVSAAITAKDAGGLTRKVLSEVDTLGLPAGVSVEVGGSMKSMSESFRQMGLAMIVAIFVVLIVMIIVFGEATAPFAILLSLPLAVIGGLVALYLAGLPLDMPAMVGSLMLIGIVVTNAIVLVDRVQQKMREGMSIRESLIEAGGVRLRPILMTAVATVSALIPMALGRSEGAFMSQSLAVIVIGGLTTSTLLTLVVVPVAFEALETLKARILRKEIAAR